MSREQQRSKNFFKLNSGLNTEANEINFPDGFTTDEANYELLIDGSRRRRKGLAIESGAGAANTVASFTDSEICQTYLWRDAGGLTDTDILVYRQGNKLHFATADSVVSDGWFTQQVDLESYETSGATTANTDNVAMSFSQGRGYLFVSGLYMCPIYITYDGSTTFTTSPIDIRIRDYKGVEDGVATTEEPTGTITDSHRYNLRNAGWPQSKMDDFDTTLSKHPAKNSIWYRGFKRTYAASISEDDGTRSWDENKLDAEGFGASPAPKGSLFLDINDTTTGKSLGEAGGVFAISTWAESDFSSSVWWIQITTSGNHGLSKDDEFTISGQRSRYSFEWVAGEPDEAFWDFNGVHTALDNGSTTSGTNIWIKVNQPPRWDVNSAGAWLSQYNQKGTVDSDASLTRDGGTAHTDAPRAVEWHAGRVFYGGMKNQEFADYIFFSQIAEGPEKFSKCYQEADPTDENYSNLVATDGGYFIIPGMSGVVNLVSLRNSLLVFSKEGVWEVSGGQRGVFTADGYSVRKLTNSGTDAVLGQQVVENTCIYTGPDGIFLIAPNQYTGQLEVTSLSQTTIQTLWNDTTVAEQQRVQMAYDTSLSKLYLMYGHTGAAIGINTMLILDGRLGAWQKYTFDTPSDNELLTGFALPNLDTTSGNEKMKFIYKASATTVQVGDFNQTTFDDWDGTNGPLPYMYTAWDNLGDFQRRRQAPVITVFNKRTETGYVDNGTGWDPTNYSSTLMSGYWDWTNDAVSGKITKFNPDGSTKTFGVQEVYRKVRDFSPSAADDIDGYPVVVTRNKLRGRGRVLQLKFEGATDKDSHILGYTINYKVSRGR